MGAPKGNQNARSGTEWRDAIRRALSRAMAREGRKRREGIDRLADTIVQEALDGHQWAILEIGNRLDGRPAQAVRVQGDESAPVQIRNVIEFKRADDQKIIDVTPEFAGMEGKQGENITPLPNLQDGEHDPKKCP